MRMSRGVCRMNRLNGRASWAIRDSWRCGCWVVCCLLLGCTSFKTEDQLKRKDGIMTADGSDTTKTESAADPSVGSRQSLSNPEKDAAAAKPVRIEPPRQRRTLPDLLLFAPTQYPQGDWEPSGLDYEDAWFQSVDGKRIHGWYCGRPDPRAVVLYAHGNGGNLSSRAPLLRLLQSEMNVAVLIFDYRGYGRSEGKPNSEAILADARAARTWLAVKTERSESDLVLMGRSLGGAVAIQLARELPPRGLIVESSFASLKDVARHHYPALAWVVSSNTLNSQAAIGQYRGPLLMSHGDADRIIPYSSGVKLFEAANEPKQWMTIPGGRHNDSPPAEYYRQLDQFLQSLPVRSAT